MLLLIDFYEKMAVSSKRRAQMNKVCAVEMHFLYFLFFGETWMIEYFKQLKLSLTSTFSPMGIIGGGSMTVQAAGAVTVPVTTAL